MNRYWILFALLLLQVTTRSTVVAQNAGVLATYEFHQLTNNPNGIELAPTVIGGETIYVARVAEGGAKWEILAVDASGGEPRVVDTWDPKHGGISYLSYSDGVIAANQGVIHKNGQNILVFTDGVITGLQGNLFSVNIGAVIKDTTTQLAAGVYRLGGGIPQPVLSSEQIARAVGVDPRFVTRIQSFSSSRDGNRIACIAMVDSEHPDVSPKVGEWFLTSDGGNVTIMNPDGKPYGRGAGPVFAVSGNGQYLIWSDYNRKDVRLGTFGQSGGSRFCSSDDYPAIAGGGSKFRFFYMGDRLAVLFGASGIAQLVDGKKPFDIVGTGEIFGRESFQVPYVDESLDGLFSFHLPVNGRYQLGMMRLNGKPEKRRLGAPVIAQYSVDPPFIANDSSRPAVQTARIVSPSPLVAVRPILRSDGFETQGDTPGGGMANDGSKEPDLVADDEYWTQNLWVHPAATGSRDIRIHAVNRDSGNYFHGFAIDIGTYNIAANPPPPQPGMIDVVAPGQRTDSTSSTGVASNGTGNSGTGSSGSGSGSGSGTASNPGTGSGNGSSSGSSTGSGSGAGNGNNSSGAGAGSGAGGTPGKPRGPTIEVARRTVEPGESATVPVYLRNPMDIANLNVEIRYDASVVTPLGEVVRGNALAGATLFSANASEPGVIRIGFAGSSPVPADGTIAEITFRAIGQRGQSSELPPNVTTMNTSSRQALTPATVTGAVTIVEKRVPGDNDGDGRLTAADALAALEMSVRLRPVDLNLDMDQDNAVTSLDAALILRAAVGGTR